ncbi:hypothetical protein B5V89_12545 [Heyndrickxia sporothermodurans]|nr:hypothetical protein B5V89_12545 [Heyndrickxia sporothermodurans]
MIKMHLLPITGVNKQIIEHFSCLLSEYKAQQEKLRRDHEKINHFLTEEAYMHHIHQLIRTYLLLNDKKNKVIGFFSLYNEEILISNKLMKRFKYKKFIIYKPKDNDIFPAIRLHQFAIDNQYQGKMVKGMKYSDILIGYVFEMVREVAEKSGCMFIGLEATENSISFYESYDFIIMKKKSENVLPFLIFKVANLID